MTSRHDRRDFTSNGCSVAQPIEWRLRTSRNGELVSVPPGAPELDAFPLIIGSVRVPWFEPGFGQTFGYEGSQLEARDREDAARDADLSAYDACAARVARAPRCVWSSRREWCARVPPAVCHEVWDRPLRSCSATKFGKALI